MDKVARVRHAEQRISSIQRRVWLAQVLLWPTIVIVAGLSVGTLVWLLRRRPGRGRHEMPDLPGAHEAGAVDSSLDGERSQP